MGDSGNTATGQRSVVRADHTGQGRPSIPQVTEAQIVAANLRRQAAELVRWAEQLEATAPKQPRRKAGKRMTIAEMLQGDK